MHHWHSDVIAINGRRLHYTRTGGDKPSLVLAHGFSEDGLVWTALAEVLARGAGLTKSNADFFVAGGEDGRHHITRVRHPIAQHPAFFDLVSQLKLLDLVEQLIGTNIQFVHSTINLKPPATEAAAYPCHQDWPFNPHTMPAVVAVMIPLDDAKAQNGCLRVVPGSHRLNRSPRPDEMAAAETVPLEAPAGTMCVMEGRVWHHTGDNVTADVTRGGIFAWYTIPIYRTQENWFLSLDPLVLQNASDTLLELLGYRARGLGLVNGRSPR